MLNVDTFYEEHWKNFLARMVLSFSTDSDIAIFSVFAIIYSKRKVVSAVFLGGQKFVGAPYFVWNGIFSKV